MFKKVGLIFNPGKKDIIKKVEKVVKWLKKRKIEVLIPEGKSLSDIIIPQSFSPEKIKKEAELIISLGGDGTLCRTAREFSQAEIPIVGINLGGLGFLTEFPVNDFEEGLEKIFSGKYIIENRMMLQSRIISENLKNQTFVALNDVVVSKSSLPRIISLKIFVSEEFVTTYSADRIIISTPTGSTAYSLSAGGPVVHPSLSLLIIAPICAHTLSVRPLIVLDKETIKVVPEPYGEDIFLTIDGQETHPLEEGDVVEVKKSPHPAKLVRLKERSFFKVLQTKLGWSGVTYRNKSK